MSTEITEEAVQRTLQGYLTVATKTGHLRGVNVEFTADGVSWHPAIFDLAEGEHPLAARARVHREGWVEPTVTVERWDEVVPADEAWRALWLVRPHVLFGAHVQRSALRKTFADVLGDRREPDDLDTLPAPARQEPAAFEAVDWAARVAAATTIDELNDVRKAARGATAVTLALKDQIDARRDELAAPVEKPARDQIENRHESRPATQDYLPPANRAARRKAARKKGSRR